ncbi:MAG: flagellar basal body protein [Massilia sp.]
MTEGMEAVTSAALGLALDAAVMRQQAIANNVANANTAGYVRQTTNFERELEHLKLTLHASSGARPELFQRVALRLEAVNPAAGAPAGVQLDSEMVDMAQNAVQYQTLLKGLMRHYAILSSAVSEGKK